MQYSSGAKENVPASPAAILHAAGARTALSLPAVPVQRRSGRAGDDAPLESISRLLFQATGNTAGEGVPVQRRFLLPENQHPRTQDAPDQSLRAFSLPAVLAQDRPLQAVKASAGGIVQRKIGFEFQAYDSAYFQPPPAATTVLGRVENQFAVEADSGIVGGELEIVTEAVEETETGRNDLKKQMTNIISFAASIHDEQMVNAIKGGGIHWEETAKDVIIKTDNRPLNFHPQATVGVKFSAVADLIDHLTQASFKDWGGRKKNLEGLDESEQKTVQEWEGKQETTKSEEPQKGQEEKEAIGADEELPKTKQELADFIGWSDKKDQRGYKETWREAYKAAHKNFNGQSKKSLGLGIMLHGFAATTYLDKNVDLYKYLMPFMPRYGLVPQYDTLSEQEKKRLPNLTKDIHDEPVFGKHELSGDGDDVVSPSYCRPTMKVVIDDLKEGEDSIAARLSPQGYKCKPDKFGMVDTSGIGDSDTEKNRQGALLELRKLGNDVAPKDLMPFALAVFDLVKLINATNPTEEEPQSSGTGNSRDSSSDPRGNQESGGPCCNCTIL